MWDNICNIFDHYKGPWLWGEGDFNDVLHANEKWGRNPVNRNRANKI